MKLRNTLITLGATVTVANASTISVLNFDGALINGIVDNSGTLIANGAGYVGIGSFTSLTDTQIQNATAVSTLVADFDEFGDGDTIGSGFGVAGVYQHTETEALGAAHSLVGASVYTFIGNASTLATSTQVLVYKHTQTFVADPGATPDAKLQENELGSLLIGGYNDFQANVGFGDAAAYNLVDISAVPEPSGAFLLGLGAVTVAFRRRR